MKTQEERDFYKGLFRVACPCCGKEQHHALYEINDFFGCPSCGEFAWLRYQTLDREHGSIYGLQLVQEP
jgi:predicted RNA-binding Zn-ribbon protein involved in translation (DUF1610 family)